jgi:ABC-2 type transport system permease protein/lipopolysaccharide transport system permease protein
MLLLPPVILITFLFTFAISVSIAVTTVYFRDMTHIVGVVLNSLFYFVPIIYPISQVPQQYQIYFTMNPLCSFINLFRLVMYDGKIPSLSDWANPVALTLVALVGALLLVRWKEKDLIFRL